VRSRAIRQSARGEPCYLQVEGVCRGGTETTVFAHVNFGGNGLATKESDLSGCYACHACHDALDGRVQADIDSEQVFRAMKTLHRLIEKGIIEVRGFEYDA